MLKVEIYQLDFDKSNFRDHMCPVRFMFCTRKLQNQTVWIFDQQTWMFSNKWGLNKLPNVKMIWPSLMDWYYRST